MSERAFPWREDIAARHETYRTLTDRAYDKIRERIVNGSLAPTGAFTEADLARTLDMSKTPVREALLRLQVENFVQAIPRRGYIVSPIQVSEIKDVFAFRRLVEGETAALAALHARPEHLEEMSNLITADESTQASDVERISNMMLINNAFHEVIAVAAGNRRLHRSTIRIIREFERFYYLEAGLPEFYDPDFVGHCDVFDAISGGEPEAARAMMGAHVESSRRVLIKAITEGTVPDQALAIRL